MNTEPVKAEGRILDIFESYEATRAIAEEVTRVVTEAASDLARLHGRAHEVARNYHLLHADIQNALGAIVGTEPGQRKGQRALDVLDGGPLVAGSVVYIRVGDVDGIAKQSDAAIVEMPWAREVCLTDPDGNRLRIGKSST
jgi:hypothetical protein